MNVMPTEMLVQNCPVRTVLSRISDKWSLLVLYTLHQASSMRFNELRKKIPDISQKMLTSTLRTMEADGYVSRAVFAEVPPRVVYSLTPRALSLIPIVDQLIVWAESHMTAILNDRRQYDTVARSKAAVQH